MLLSQMAYFALATTPSPSVPLPQGEREAKPLSLDGGVATVSGQREVGERVLVMRSPYLIIG
jgi:hypothetical protein